MSEKNLVLTDDLFEKLPEEEKNSEWDRFRKNKLALAGLIFLIVMILLAIIVPQVAPYKFDTQDMANRNAMPSLQHLFGTDKLGRDIFVRVMYGARVSLAIGFSTAAINLVIGILYGGISGYVGGRVDMIMMRIVDIIYAVPSLIYVVLILLVFGDSIGSMMLAICLTSWIGMARQVRTQIMSLKEMEFSLAAKVIGASNPRILSNHRLFDHDGSGCDLYRSFIELCRYRFESGDPELGQAGKRLPSVDLHSADPGYLAGCGDQLDDPGAELRR